MYKDIVKPILVLIIIVALVSGVLAITYNLTGVGELGKGIPQNELDTIVKEIIPNGTKLNSMDTSLDDKDVLGVYKEENNKGVAVHVQSKGYGQEPLVLIVGLDMDGKFTGAKILKTTETPGVGTKIENKDFIEKFKGTADEVKLKKDDGSIDEITGATISSRAFAQGVNKAFETFNEIKGDL